MHLPVVVSGFAIPDSLNQLGSCGPIASCGRDQRLDFECRYFRALISKIVWMNGTRTMLRSVIFSFTWIITIIIRRKSMILVRT